MRTDREQAIHQDSSRLRQNPSALTKILLNKKLQMTDNHVLSHNSQCAFSLAERKGNWQGKPNELLSIKKYQQVKLLKT